MQIKPIPPQPTDTTFKRWSNIRSQVTRYGKSQVNMTEYNLDNGKKLITLHTWRNGKKVAITKELYNNGWNLVKAKLIEFKDGIRKIKEM